MTLHERAERLAERLTADEPPYQSDVKAIESELRAVVEEAVAIVKSESKGFIDVNAGAGRTGEMVSVETPLGDRLARAIRARFGVEKP